MGEVGHGAEASTVGVPHQQEATFEEAMQLDPNTLERINALKKAKNQAVSSDDYDEAQRLKEAIERLRSIGTHLAQLEERKKIAADKEDYAAAKIIKMEIERLRETAMNPAFHSGPYAPQPDPSEAKTGFGGGPEAPMARGPESFKQPAQAAPQFPQPGAGFQPPPEKSMAGLPENFDQSMSQKATLNRTPMPPAPNPQFPSAQPSGAPPTMPSTMGGGGAPKMPAPSMGGGPPVNVDDQVLPAI